MKEGAEDVTDSKHDLLDMSANSGLTGFCKSPKCKYPNNEHDKNKCKETGCRKQWKICQTGLLAQNAKIIPLMDLMAFKNTRT
jgi:hypothetical protein